jgi:hypothetical protein
MSAEDFAGRSMQRRAGMFANQMIVLGGAWPKSPAKGSSLTFFFSP